MISRSSAEIRNLFLRFFEKNDHAIVPSSSLLPAGDPSLLFTNAGMNQFKDLFLGREQRSYTRATSSQKCVRVGGKHNDLDNVGFTPRHHTFFEMLGNFSFGDYFKKEAIAFAWELVTRDYGVDPEKVWATVFEKDDEAFAIWRDDVALPTERIIRMGAKDNYWAMGETGPCGPCSELFFDQGPSVGCGRPDCSPACECGRYLEFWNLVFMQFNRDENGEMTPLPSPSIDTGLGLERMAAILQGVTSNYETDLFLPLIREVGEIAGTPYESAGEGAPAYHVIADHARAVAFLIADGVFPSNEGRGYVLRRIIRRSLRYAHKIGCHAPVLSQIVDSVVKSLGDVYPAIGRESATIKEIVTQEEKRFEATLDRGVDHVNEAMAAAIGSGTLRGGDLFTLYDTYGIPLDLVEEMAKEKNLTLDRDGFEEHLDRQRERSKEKQAFKDDYQGLYEALARRVPPTTFTGYDILEGKGKVLALLLKGDEQQEAREGEEVEVIVDTTPFYAESGGQVGDTGTFTAPSGEGDVLDVKKVLPTLFIHRLKVGKGIIRTEDPLILKVDAERRGATTRHHTATHLLHAALRSQLGAGVKQMGSLVNPEKLRFDFSFSRALTQEEIAIIETWANRAVLSDVPVTKEVLPIEEAKKRGALAFFDEKYGEEVRVIQIPGFSMEFCGGCHVDRSGQIGLIKITGEHAIAAGVRRIEAVAGLVALDLFQEENALFHDIEAHLPGSREGLPERVTRLQEHIKALEAQVREWKEKAALGGGGEEETVSMDGFTLLTQKVTDMETPLLRSLADGLRQKIGRGVVILGNRTGAKTMILVAVTDDLTGKISASTIARRLGAAINGSGGGKSHLAQAGGKTPKDFDAFMKRIPGIVEEAGKEGT